MFFLWWVELHANVQNSVKQFDSFPELSELSLERDSNLRPPSVESIVKILDLHMFESLSSIWLLTYIRKN